MRGYQRYLLPSLLSVLVALMPIGPARAHPTVFFPGQAFCPPRALMVGGIIMPQAGCFSVFLMRTPRRAFLGFLPAGLFVFPSGQIIGVSTSLGAHIRARTLVLLPIVLSAIVVPVDTIRLEPFQIEDMGGGLGIRLAEDPDTVVPITPASPQGLTQLSDNASGFPVPTDLRILQPGPDVPRDEAVFSGKWSGRWQGQGDSVADAGLPHLLVIERITSDDGFLTSERRAGAVFAWGTSSRWGILPGWTRVEGAFQRGILLLALPSGVHVSYRMSIDGTLDATYEGPNFGVMRATLSRTK